jgi:hypothetical protein
MRRNTNVVAEVGARGPDAPPESLNSDAKTSVSDGLDNELTGAQVVVDLTHSPSFENAAVLESFEISTAYFGDVEHSFRLIPHARFG